jgi:hypothetical protein
MGAGEVNMKERISMTRTKYFVLKEILKFHECGWSQSLNLQQRVFFTDS